MQSHTSPDGNDSAVDFSYFTRLLLYEQAMESLIDADSGSESFSSDDETSGKSKMSIRSEVNKPVFNVTDDVSKSESQAAWTRWSSNFLDYLVSIRFSKLLNAEKHYGYPTVPDMDDPGITTAFMKAFPKVKVEGKPDSDASASILAMKEKYLKTTKPRINKARRRHMILRGILNSVCSTNPGAQQALDAVPDEEPKGFRCYAALRDYAMKLDSGADRVDDYQLKVTTIPNMHSSVEVKAWLNTYRVIWKNWKSKFTVTSYEPTPWYNKVSAELITGHILQGLPKEDSWMTFRTIHIQTFKTSTVESAIDLITEHLGMTLAAHESNQPSGNMPANPMVGGQNIDCYLCKEHGESVDTRGHKPSEAACPYHDEWKQKGLAKSKERQDRRNAKKQGDRGQSRGKGSGKGNGGKGARKGPSKEHPCTICGSSEHWARECPAQSTQPAMPMMQLQQPTMSMMQQPLHQQAMAPAPPMQPMHPQHQGNRPLPGLIMTPMAPGTRPVYPPPQQQYPQQQGTYMQQQYPMAAAGTYMNMRYPNMQAPNQYRQGQ